MRTEMAGVAAGIWLMVASPEILCPSKRRGVGFDWWGRHSCLSELPNGGHSCPSEAIRVCSDFGELSRVAGQECPAVADSDRQECLPHLGFVSFTRFAT